MADGEPNDDQTNQDPPAGSAPGAAGGDGAANNDSTDWKAEAEKWKANSRKNEATAKANADAAKRLAEIEESNKSESQKAAEARAAAEKDAVTAKGEAARLRVALRKGLTEAQAKRLVGETEEELEKDAEDLIATFTGKQESSGSNGAKEASSSRPRERLRSGTMPGKDPEETDPIKLAAAVPR